jgi:GTP1/Obg family GTP-binding protein
MDTAIDYKGLIKRVYNEQYSIQLGTKLGTEALQEIADEVFFSLSEEYDESQANHIMKEVYSKLVKISDDIVETLKVLEEIEKTHL